MKVDEIKRLMAYNDWCDERILAACASVTPEQYAAPATRRGGLRETMIHILDNIWQQRITLQGYYNESEAAVLLTEYGRSPGDFIHFLNERANPTPAAPAK